MITPAMAYGVPSRRVPLISHGCSTPGWPWATWPLFAAALGRSPLYAGQREQVREILASLRDGRRDSARASALAFAETLTAPAGPGGDNTEIIAHRFAGSVTDFTDALSQWLVLGAQDQPGGGALFAPAVPLRQGGSLSVTAAATAEASSTAEPSLTCDVTVGR
jgi:hypothetical protein